MCDYSLMSVPNRLAVEGEELVTHRFSTGSMGLASPSGMPGASDSIVAQPKNFWSRLKDAFTLPKAECELAVCIPPGARLMVKDVPERLQRKLGVGPAEEVAFTQLTAAANSYRDAVRFRNSRTILLQDLREGLRFQVLGLSPKDAEATDRGGRESQAATAAG
jgi:hypothetical protein